MKPAPCSDFPVTVYAEASEHDSAVRHYYNGIYSIALNHTVDIAVVPSLRQHPWPPPSPEEVDEVESVDEARQAIAALATITITPDSERANTEVRWTSSEGSHVVLFVSPAEFSSLTVELGMRLEQQAGFHGGVPVSQVGPELKQVIERAIGTGQLSTYELELLGRA